jgi:hypothetical protein
MAPKRRLTLEPLEDRTTPALFGYPWPDPQHLTLSFVPDGTPIAGSVSNLFQSLNAVKPAAQWQNEMLRAIQTWESVANISVTVVPDGGQPFGAPGNPQSDSHFGDIRIGAEPMASSSLALAIPPDPTYSGTWAGEIILNSHYTFDGPGTDLYSVMLHEFGHALGLPENSDPSSVMGVNSPALLNQLSPSAICCHSDLVRPAGFHRRGWRRRERPVHPRGSQPSKLGSHNICPGNAHQRIAQPNRHTVRRRQPAFLLLPLCQPRCFAFGRLAANDHY